MYSLTSDLKNNAFLLEYGKNKFFMNENLTVIDHCLDLYKEYCSTSAFGLHKNQDIIHPLFGGCMINRKTDTVFMHIDKCASNSITDVLQKKGFELITEKWDFVVEDKHKVFAVIRDPVIRWASGLNEYMYRYLGSHIEEHTPMYGKIIPDKMYLTVNQVEQQVLNKKLIFDEHTAPQNLFLIPVNALPIKLIRMDENLEEKLEEFLHLKIQLPFFNSSKDRTPCYKNFCENLFDIYVKDTQHFFSVYQQDFELFKKSI